MTTPTLITAEQFDQLPEEQGRFELLDGELIELSSTTPRHNDIVGNVLISMKPQMLRQKTGMVVLGTEFAIGQDRLRPDIAILLAAKWAQVDMDRVPVKVIPDVAIEVVSPSESALQLERKIARYLAGGVQEVWVIYPDPRTLYVHTSAGVRRLTATDILKSPLLEGWSTVVGDLFSSL